MKEEKKQNPIVEFILEEHPEASPTFVEIMVEAIELHSRKRHDYNGPAFIQTYSEFETVGKFWDIKRKYDRMYNKMVKKEEFKVSESLEDTAIDLGNYAFLFLEYIRNMKKS